MVKKAKDSHEVSIKVVLLGQGGSGKASILRQLASNYGQASVRTGIISEAEVTRTEFIWPEPIEDGSFVRVRVYALSGNPQHQAAEQLLLLGADAIVYVADCEPRYITARRDNLLAIVGDSSDENLELALQYNHAENYPELRNDDLDNLLVDEGRGIAHFLTSPTNPDSLGVAVHHVVKKVIYKLGAELSKS